MKIKKMNYKKNSTDNKASIIAKGGKGTQPEDRFTTHSQPLCLTQKCKQLQPYPFLPQPLPKLRQLKPYPTLIIAPYKGENFDLQKARP
jgi:hypothetical protein